MPSSKSTRRSHKAPRRRLKYLKHTYLPSDDHEFVGRIYELSIVAYNFDSYDEMAKYSDCKYALGVNELLSLMTRRVETLNIVSDMMWLDEKFLSTSKLPISRFQWLNVTADAFLMRFVSVYDCALLLTNEVLELGLPAQKTNLKNIKRKALKVANIIGALEKIELAVQELRQERNTRFHRGWERQHTSDDRTFYSTTAHETRGREWTGSDIFGRKIDNEKFFREGLVNLQRDYNRHCPRLIKQVDLLYDQFSIEFDARFSRKFNDPSTGFGYKERMQRV